MHSSFKKVASIPAPSFIALALMLTASGTMLVTHSSDANAQTRDNGGGTNSDHSRDVPEQRGPGITSGAHDRYTDDFYGLPGFIYQGEHYAPTRGGTLTGPNRTGACNMGVPGMGPVRMTLSQCQETLDMYRAGERSRQRRAREDEARINRERSISSAHDAAGRAASEIACVTGRAACDRR